MERSDSVRRGSHVARREATRARVFAATTDIIDRDGYAALTTMLAAEQARSAAPRSSSRELPATSD